MVCTIRKKVALWHIVTHILVVIKKHGNRSLELFVYFQGLQSFGNASDNPIFLGQLQDLSISISAASVAKDTV